MRLTASPLRAYNMTMFRTFSLALRKYLGPSVCPMVRYLFPVSFLYEPAKTITWFSPDPTPLGTPEKTIAKILERIVLICLHGNGIGLYCFGTYFTSFYFDTLLAEMTVPTFHLISVLLRLASTAIESAYEITHFIVTRMDESLVWLIDEVLVLKHRHGLNRSKNRRDVSRLPSQPSQRR